MYAQYNNPLPVWIICHKLTNLYLQQFSAISGGNCIKQDGKAARVHYKAVKQRATQSLQWDRNDRIETLLEEAESTIQSDPK